MAFCILSESILHSFNEWSIPHDMIFSPSRSKSCRRDQKEGLSAPPEVQLPHPTDSPHSGLRRDDLLLPQRWPPTCPSECSTGGERDLRRVPHGVKTAVGTIPTAPALKPGGSKVTFADRQQQVRIPGVKLQLIDGVPMADVVLQPETSLGYSGRTHRGGLSGAPALYLDALHGDVVDDADDAAGAGDGQQGVAGVGVVRPRARVEVFICLSAWGQGKTTSHVDLS